MDMKLDRIDDIICEIMVNDGPDFHIDGHDVITSFVAAVQAGHGEEWFAKYMKDKTPKFVDG